MYTCLIFITSYSLELFLSPETSDLGFTTFLLLFVVSLFLTIFYAWLLISRNRRTWATLKCIGYTNRNINWIVIGQITFTTLVGFIIVIEVLFHYNSIMVYLQAADTSRSYNVANIPLITLWPVVITIGMFIFVQIVGYLIMKGKITKVRPMIALKRVGE